MRSFVKILWPLVRPTHAKNNKNKNWLQFLVFEEAAALKQQISKFFRKFNAQKLAVTFISVNSYIRTSSKLSSSGRPISCVRWRHPCHLCPWQDLPVAKEIKVLGPGNRNRSASDVSQARLCVCGSATYNYRARPSCTSGTCWLRNWPRRWRVVWMSDPAMIDYCNAVLHGSPSYTIKKLQHVQNNAARIVLHAPRRSHASPLLRMLHWLPVQQKIEYKVALLNFIVCNTSTPAYLRHLIQDRQ